jgi:pimeloyl-ACP methyl ester carboxylesterase
MSEDTLSKPELRTVDTALGRVRYVEAGAGQVVVFIDGIMSGFTWMNRPGIIPRGCRYISVEFVELAPFAEPPDAEAISKARAAVLAQFLDTLGVDKIHLFSDTAGAATAMAFALDHRDRMRSLSVASTGLPPAAAPFAEPRTIN